MNNMHSSGSHKEHRFVLGFVTLIKIVKDTSTMRPYTSQYRPLSGSFKELRFVLRFVTLITIVRDTSTIRPLHHSITLQVGPTWSFDSFLDLLILLELPEIPLA